MERMEVSRARVVLCARALGVLLILLLAQPVAAQRVIRGPDGQPIQIGPDGQPIPPGGAPPTKPAEPPATTQAVVYVPATTKPVDPKTASISLNFKDATADSALDYLAEATGYTLVKESVIDGRVTIQTRRPVTPPEAVQLLNTVLRINGYTLMLQDKELRVLPRAKAKKADVPVHFGADPEQIPATDELITQIIPLGKSDASRLKADLQPLVSVDADFTANRDNNSLILTDVSRNVRRVVQIAANLDRQGASSSEMRIVKLKHADATITAKMIGQVFKGGSDSMSPQMMFMMQQSGQMQGDALDRALRGGRNVTAVPDDRTGTIVVTGPSDSLKIVDKIIESLDADEIPTMEVRIFTLKYADADSAAKLVTDMFKEDKGQDNNPFRFYYFGMPQSDQGAKSGKINATADFRTGTLVVTAPPPQMKIIADVLEKLDTNPATESAFFIYRLKNGQAPKLMLVLNTLFGVGPENGQQGGQNQQNNGQQPYNGQQQGNSNNQNRGRSSIGGAFGSQGSGGTGIGARRGGRNGQGQNGRTPQLSSNSQHMIGEMAGEVFVVADEDTNSLLVTTASKYRDQVRLIIAELDRPVPQVLIKVLVAEVTHDNSDDLGLDFSILNQRANKRGFSVGSTLGNAAASSTGGLVVNLVEKDINVTLHALASAGKLDVLSRPYILASDNQLATITVGQEVPFITDTRTTELGQVLNTIQYQDVGIILNVTPHINEEGLVILDVTPEISQLTTSTVPISQGVSAPIISKRSADSRVGIRDGQTIVIGGLMEDKKSSTLTKVPLLGDIPLIGPLFQRTQVAKRKTELLIFLTPHVAQQPESLKSMSEDEMTGTKLTPGAVEPGTFDEHIRGMKRGAAPATKPAATTRPEDLD